MSTQVKEVAAAVSEDKTPVTRLLDMLAGWTRYVSHDEDHRLVDTQVSAEEIGALYQEAASTLLKMEPGAQEAAVPRFVAEHIVPVLLGHPVRALTPIGRKVAQPAPDTNARKPTRKITL